MAKFSMNDLLNNQSKTIRPEAEEETKQWEIRNIPISKIVPSPENKYGIRDIEDLAANIEMVGLLHNLVVQNGSEPGTYEIISGERRYEALKLLVSQGKAQYGSVPCKVEKSENPAIAELQLLFANSMARELTDYEKTYQAGRIKELLKEVKKSGYEFKGRMREIVADMLKVSPAQMGRMESINKNLAPEFKEEFKAGNISVTAAYELSRLPPQQQEQEMQDFKESGSVEIKDVQEKREKAKEPAPLLPTEPQPTQQTKTPVLATATQPAQRSDEPQKATTKLKLCQYTDAEQCRFENCHIYEDGENLQSIADNCEVLIKAATLRKLIDK